MEDMFKGSNRDMANFIFQVVTFTKGIFSKTKRKAMEKCFGLTVAFTKDNGRMEFKVGKGKYI